MRLWFITAIFGLMLLPIIQMTIHFAPEYTVNENRALAPIPNSKIALDKFPKAADLWFGDHFGFRSLLISAKAQIDWSIFGTSDRVIVGRSGQLFYKSLENDSIPSYESLLSKKSDIIIHNIDTLTTTLKRQELKPSWLFLR